MAFAYYQRLSPQQKAIYRQSDALQAIILPLVIDAQRWVVTLEAALKTGNSRKVQFACAGLLDELTTVLGVSKMRMRVLARRPADAGGELQGLYELSEGASLARITVWMRTAQRKQLVAFRTFLRTVLHELCHHLDYELYRLRDSFHTEGFYKRETSLFKQLFVQPSEQ